MKDAEQNPEEQPRPSQGDADAVPDIPGDEDWANSAELAQAEPSAREMADFDATIRRIGRMIGIAGLVFAAALVRPFGLWLAAGLLLGAALAWLNFHWLASSVNAVGERIVKIHSTERGAVVVARGVSRIFLIVLLAYVIFRCSVRGLVGFFAGLSMPVVALMCEAVYEFVAARRRSS